MQASLTDSTMLHIEVIPIDKCPLVRSLMPRYNARKALILNRFPTRDHSLDLAITDIGSGDRAGSSSRSNVLALEVTEEAGVGGGEGTRAAKSVTLAATANVRAADTAAARNSEVLASSSGLDDCIDILEFVSVGRSV